MTQPPSNTSGTKMTCSNANVKNCVTNNNSNNIKLFSFSSFTDVSNATNNAAGVCYKSDINTTTSYSKNHKKLILIRHGTSLGNEFMEQPGNRWGDKTFTDDISLVDASLSQTGISQANMLR